MLTMRVINKSLRLRVKLLFLFYRRVAIPLSLFTIACGIIIWQFGVTDTIGALIWIKILSSMVVYFLTSTFRSNEHYLFYNLNVSPIKAYIYVFLLDFLVFIVFSFLASLKYSF